MCWCLKTGRSAPEFTAASIVRLNDVVHSREDYFWPRRSPHRFQQRLDRRDQSAVQDRREFVRKRARLEPPSLNTGEDSSEKEGNGDVCNRGCRRESIALADQFRQLIFAEALSERF